MVRGLEQQIAVVQRSAQKIGLKPTAAPHTTTTRLDQAAE
jgi:hypothetical protein